MGHVRLLIAQGANGWAGKAWSSSIVFLAVAGRGGVQQASELGHDAESIACIASWKW
jgi:hypothetical protein